MNTKKKHSFFSLLLLLTLVGIPVTQALSGLHPKIEKLQIDSDLRGHKITIDSKKEVTIGKDDPIIFEIHSEKYEKDSATLSVVVNKLIADKNEEKAVSALLWLYYKFSSENWNLQKIENKEVNSNLSDAENKKILITLNRLDQIKDYPLHSAAFKGYLEIVKDEVHKGTPVDTKENTRGSTALGFASHFGHYDIVKYLIDKGADVNAKNKKNFTALYAASRFGHYDIVKYLIDKGADVNAKNKKNRTALGVASRFGHYDIVKYLIDKGADVNAKTKKGVTPLMASCFNSNPTDVAKLLIDNGAKVYAKSVAGSTALHFAARSGNIANVNLLLENFADVNAKTKKGVTPLMYAAKKGNIEIVKLLLENWNWADVDLKDEKGKSALYYAKNEGHKEIESLLDTANRKQKNLPPPKYDCSETQAEDLTAAEIKALTYLIEKKYLGKAQNACIENVTVKDKFPLRQNQLIKFSALLFFPLGYRTECLEVDSSNLDRDFSWSGFMKLSDCSSISSPIGGPVEPGGKRTIEGEEEL